MWRRMAAADLPRVKNVADRVHPSYPEDSAIFAERLALYPAGCLVLENATGGIDGYAISHPWIDKEPPALNTRLGRLPDRPSTFYLHDVALLPSARGNGRALELIESLIQHAHRAGFSNLSLVAVSESQAFWRRCGFALVVDPTLDGKLRSYDDDARLMLRELNAAQAFV